MRGSGVGATVIPRVMQKDLQVIFPFFSARSDGFARLTVNMKPNKKGRFDKKGLKNERVELETEI